MHTNMTIIFSNLYLDLFAVHNVGYPAAIGAVSVINHYYGRDNIKLGAFKGEFGKSISGKYWSFITKYTQRLTGVYIDDLVNNFDSPVKHYDQVSDALTVLRETLSEAEDNSVVIVSLGFLHNIAQLLKSPADDVSSLTGMELVRRKVRLLALLLQNHNELSNCHRFCPCI